MNSSNITKYIGMIIVAIAIIFIISGASLFINNFFNSPNVEMSPEDFLAAMNETSARVITRMTLLAIGGFSLMANICLSYYGYDSNISLKFFSKNKKNLCSY